MARTRRTIATALLAALLAVGLIVGLVHTSDDFVPVDLSGTEPLPTLTGKDVTTGTPIDMRDYRGSPLVINAWAEWCAECREEAPILTSFASDHPSVSVVGIVGNSRRSLAIEANGDLGWTWPSLFDPYGDRILRTLTIQSYPSTLFVDADGTLRGIRRGPVTRAELDDAIARLT